MPKGVEILSIRSVGRTRSVVIATYCTSEKKRYKYSDNDSQSSQTKQMDKMKKDLKKTKKSFATLQTQFEELEEEDDASKITGSGDESGS